MGGGGFDPPGPMTKQSVIQKRRSQKIFGSFGSAAHRSFRAALLSHLIVVAVVVALLLALLRLVAITDNYTVE